jgi:hypothetical protein
MKMKLGCFVLCMMFCVPAGVRAQDVTYNFARDTNFSQYKTFKWVDIPGAASPNQIVDKDIKQSIENQLASKGLAKSDDDAQLYIGYQVSISQEKSITAFNSGGNWGYGPGWGRGYGYGSPSMSTATTSTINIGTLVLDMYDPAKKDLVWRGEASKALSPSKDPNKNRSKIDKAMAKLLKNYPPQSKQ